MVRRYLASLPPLVSTAAATKSSRNFFSFEPSLIGRSPLSASAALGKLLRWRPWRNKDECCSSVIEAVLSIAFKCSILSSGPVGVVGELRPSSEQSINWLANTKVMQKMHVTWLEKLKRAWHQQIFVEMFVLSDLRQAIGKETHLNST